jgi:type VI secretion system protein ImpG
VRDDLLEYYERELAFLRRDGAEFARRYPKVASRLELEPTKCEDPHVERLLEGFAFLAARLHLRMDEDLPEISEALLDAVHPQYVRPIPSLSLVQLELDPSQSHPPEGYRVPRGERLESRPVGGEPCRFRTCYETVLWPLRVTGTEWLGGGGGPGASRRSRDAVGALRLELEAFSGIELDELRLGALRFHIGADAGLTSALYELLLNHCLEIVVSDPTPGSRAEPFALEPSALRPVGFGEDETLLPPPKRALLAYAFLQEYFAFPEKFHFVELEGLQRIAGRGFGSRLRIDVQLRSFERPDWRTRMEEGLSEETVRLGCTPIVNLFDRASEPIVLSERRSEYPVVPDARRRDSIFAYSVNDVRLMGPGVPEPVPVSPFYAPGDPTEKVFWRARRRAAGWREGAPTEIHLSLVDLSSRTVHPEQDVVTVGLTCHNGELPSRLPFGSDDGDFRLEEGGPLGRIRALVKPTPLVQPALGKAQLWRLISQLSLNYGSLSEGGATSLRRLLELQNVSGSGAGTRQIQGIRELTGEPVHARVRTEHGVSFARGHLVDLLVDEEDFAGGSVFLLSSVLERFLGLYTSINSFTTLRVRSMQRREAVKQWPPRAGWKSLV